MKAFYLTLCLFLAWANIAQAQSLSEPALFSRCYAQIVGKPVPRGSAMMMQIKAGGLKAQAACTSLLDRTELPKGGGQLNVVDDETKAILNNFYNFHRTWFSTNSVEQIQSYNNEIGLGTTDMYDTTEPALAITRTLFAKDTKYSDVLTLDTGVHAMRVQDENVRARYGYTTKTPSRRFYGNNADFDNALFAFFPLNGVWDNGVSSQHIAVPHIEVGDLVGVRTTTESFQIPNVGLVPFAQLPGNQTPGLNYNPDILKTFGGGVLGAPIYFLLNYGQTFNTPSNGTTKLPRRWSQQNITTFMCRQLPALRESDIRQNLVGNSSAPFRNSTTCLQCHSSLDPMAYTARNLAIADTDFAATGTYKTAVVAVSYQSSLASSPGWPSEPVTDFHRQMPTGRLYYRSASGDLVDRSVNNLSEMGKAMTDQTDYYQCAAKRYFEYFTGISVSLYDRQDPANAALNKSLSADSIADRKFIESLATDLQKNQSLKTMIKSILASPYYRSATFR